jgi:hypothetical protein
MAGVADLNNQCAVASRRESVDAGKIIERDMIEPGQPVAPFVEVLNEVVADSS